MLCFTPRGISLTASWILSAGDAAGALWPRSAVHGTRLEPLCRKAIPCHAVGAPGPRQQAFHSVSLVFGVSAPARAEAARCCQQRVRHRDKRSPHMLLPVPLPQSQAQSLLLNSTRHSLSLVPEQSVSVVFPAFTSPGIWKIKISAEPG